MDAPALLRFVSDPTRHAILTTLRDGPHSVTQLIDATSKEQSNVSHHLAKLRDVGLVRTRTAGRERHYRLADAEVATLLAQVEALADRLDQVAYVANLELPYGPGYHGYG